MYNAFYVEYNLSIEVTLGLDQIDLNSKVTVLAGNSRTVLTE